MSQSRREGEFGGSNVRRGGWSVVAATEGRKVVVNEGKCSALQLPRRDGLRREVWSVWKTESSLSRIVSSCQFARRG